MESGDGGASGGSSSAEQRFHPTERKILLSLCGVELSIDTPHGKRFPQIKFLLIHDFEEWLLEGIRADLRVPDGRFKPSIDTTNAASAMLRLSVLISLEQLVGDELEIKMCPPQDDSLFVRKSIFEKRCGQYSVYWHAGCSILFYVGRTDVGFTHPVFENKPPCCLDKQHCRGWSM